jgi:hypothetical protein
MNYGLLWCSHLRKPRLPEQSGYLLNTMRVLQTCALSHERSCNLAGVGPAGGIDWVSRFEMDMENNLKRSLRTRQQTVSKDSIPDRYERRVIAGQKIEQPSLWITQIYGIRAELESERNLHDLYKHPRSSLRL